MMQQINPTPQYPAQIALGYMIGDIFKFMGIFTLVSVAFAAGLFSIYHHYHGQEAVVNGKLVVQKDAFYKYVLCYPSVTPPATPLLHLYYLSVTPLLHLCYTSITPLLPLCYSSFTPLLHLYYTSVTPLLPLCYTSITPML